MKTRDRITEAALSLFAENGFNGTSVKQIADAVGIKDASLYKHYKSKQEIFPSIVILIKRHMSDLSGKLQLPTEEELGNDADILTQMDVALLKTISRDAFVFYFSDPYVSRFWKIAHMEQYINEEIYGMFRRLFIEDAIDYLTQLMIFLSKKAVLRTADPRAAAISYYAPIFLLLTKYADQPEKKMRRWSCWTVRWKNSSGYTKNKEKDGEEHEIYGCFIHCSYRMQYDLRCMDVF